MKALSEIEIKYYENDVVKVRYKAPVTASAFVHYELMNSHYVKLSFHSAKAIGFRIGDFIELPNWGRFEIVEPVKPQYDGAEYTYEPQFEAYYRKWKNKKVRYIPESGSPEAYFTLTASILVHARIILRNLAYLVSKDKSYLFNRNYTSTDKDTIGDNNAVYGKTDFTIFVDSTVDVKKARNISYQNINILDAITQVASTFECEWWVTENVIHFGECKLEQKADVELKSGTNVASISSSPSTSNYFTRLLSFGAARNLPDTYKKDGITDVTKDGVVEQRLMLPTVDELIEYAATSDTAKAVVDKVNKELSDNGFELVGNYLQVKGLSEQQYIEGAVTNDDDYPKNIIEIGKVETYAKEVKNNATADENDTITRTYYRLSGLKLVNEDGVQIGEPEFLDKYILKGKDLSILFQSGSLNGLDFTCKFNPLGKPLYKMNSNGAFVDKDGNETTDKSKYVVNPESQCFEVCANENYGRALPDPDLCPKVGDTFVLYNWDATMMPGNLIMEASVDLLLDTIEYLKKSMIDPTTYTATMLSDYVFKSKRYFSLGEAVKLNNPAFFTTPRDSRVIGYEIKLDIPWDSPQYIIGEKPSYSKIGDLAQRVSELTYNGKSYSGSGIGGTSVYIVTSNDNTPFSDTNTLSSLRAQKEFLSKTQDDTAQGLITFVKGLISEMLAQLKGGATFGKSGYKFDKDGNVVVDALSSLAFDEALERGFGVTKNSRGKYTLSVTDLMVWGKAVFNSLEIRKLYAVGGNVYLSGASSKIVRAVPVKRATDTGTTENGDASAEWVACAEGDADCEGWKCYTLNDDGTTATQNGWRKYDQAKCQTFDIEAGAHEGVSNTYYWRLVADVSAKNETITETRTETYVDKDGVTKTREVTVDLYDGKKFGWVVLSKTDCESRTNDAPKAGDTIVLDGHRMFASGDAEGRDQYNDESRTNVMMLETTGVSDGSLPHIVALTGITDYKHSDGKNEYSNTVFILSPKEVVFVSSSIKWISASGDPITFVNFRGNWAKDTEYAYYDQVSHNNAIWTCIVEKGTTTTEEPSDTSAVWRKEISGGKGEKGDKGEDAVTYGVQLSSTYEVFSDAKKHAGIKVAYTKTTGMTVSSYGTVQVLGTAKVYADGTEIKSASDHLNNGYNTIIFDYYTFDGTNNTASIGTASVISIELIVDDKIVATANYSNGKQGDGVVMAYKHADTQPDAPTGTDPEYPGDGWSLSPDAATAGEKVTNVRYGGYESGTYDGNNKGTDATAKEWAEAEDDGRTWMKSPSGLSYNYGYAMMKVSFITQYDNTTVDVEIKAYSEQNYDLVEVWALDTAPSTGTSFRGQGLAHASGNGVEQAYSFTVAKAGRHFICVTYAKDISGDDNGDYGLFRLDLSDNEVAVSDTVWMSQAKVSGGKCVLPWSTPVKINGADGIGALEISVAPDTLVFDTNDDGIVPSGTSKTATIACYRDGKKVTNVEYALMEGGHPDCSASISTSNSKATVTISDIATDETCGVSKTSGTVEVQVYDKDNGRYYFPTVKFAVNVAKFNGGLKADNKKFESAYNYLTNDGKSKDFKQFESKIRQTAKEISLLVSEKRAGRRNLLPGSAFRKQGEGCEFRLGKGGYGIQAVGGYEGTNCVRALAQGDNYAGVYWWGLNGMNKNIKIKRNTRYTLSVWAKAASVSVHAIMCEAIYEKAETGFARDGSVSKVRRSYPTIRAGEWQQFMLTVQTDGSHDWMECNFWATTADSSTAIDVLFCRPMLEEGEEYNGWTLSEQDYDYVGGNLLDGTGTLAKTGNVETLNPDNVTQGGMGESASIRAVLSPTDTYVDFLQFSTSGMGIKANEDYVLSFYAKTEDNAGKLQCYLYPSEGGINTEDSESGYDNSWNQSDGHLRSEIVPGTQWKRYWVHWRPTKADPKHVLFRLLRDGNDRGTYSSYTTYAVDDVVLYDGTYYRCIKAGQGNTPSSSSSYWKATYYEISLSQPKLEVGATMTEWTAKRADMVDKQALYATGIDIDSKKITLTADHTYVRTNDGTPTVLIDADGYLTNVKVNADMVNVSATHKLSISGNGAMVVDMDNFKLDASGNASFKGSIESTSGRISFLTFTKSGMYSANSSSLWGLGLMSTNISVRGTPGGRISLVCLGDGHKDATGGDANTYPKSLVDGQNVNYSNLIQVTGGGKGNGRDAAALGIETDGDFCLSAMGGLSHLQGLSLDTSTTSGSPNRTLFLCSRDRFTMPSNPKDGQLVIVIQTTTTRITFDGGGKSFKKGASTSNTATSGSAGQWNFFVYDDSVSSWRCVYANGGLF